MASTQPNESSNLFYRKAGSIEITVVRRCNRVSVGLGVSKSSSLADLSIWQDN